MLAAIFVAIFPIASPIAPIDTLFEKFCAILSDDAFALIVSDAARLLLVNTPHVRPTTHAPTAQFQPRPLPPGSHESVPAVELDSFAHFFYYSSTEPIPDVDVFAVEDASLVRCIQWMSSHLYAPFAPSIADRRRSAISALSRLSAKSRPYTHRLQSLMSPSVLRISKRYNVALVHALVIATRFSYIDLAFHLVVGFPNIGVVPDTMCHRLKYQPATCAVPSSDQMHSWNKQQISRLRRNGRKAGAKSLQQMRECYAATVAEVDDGWATGPFTLSETHEMYDAFWVIPRFPHYRTPEHPCRPVDDCRRSRHNKCTTLFESIACENCDFPARVARMFVALLGRIVVWFGTDDLKKAYRQVPVRNEEFNIVACFNPDIDDVSLFVVHGSVFGAISSVNNFNALSSFIEHCARCVVGACCARFYDDFAVCEPSLTARSAQLSMFQLAEILGFQFDVKKHRKAGPVNAFLGVVTDLSQLLSGVIILTAKPGRVAKLVRALQHVLDSKQLSSAAAASLRGKLYFLTTSCAGRAGVAALLPFTLRQYSNSSRLSLNDELIAAITFFLALLSCLPPRRISVEAEAAKSLRVWSDAMLSDGIARVGYVVYDPEDQCLTHATSLVPPYVLGLFHHVDHCIGQLEILAALLVYLSLPSARLRDRRVSHFIDNSSSMCSLFKGYSKASDSALLINIFHLVCASLRCSVYWFYVRSKANIADMPSRNVLAPFAKLRSVLSPVLMPTAEQLRAPLEVWLRRSVPRVRMCGAVRRALKRSRAN